MKTQQTIDTHKKKALLYAEWSSLGFDGLEMASCSRSVGQQCSRAADAAEGDAELNYEHDGCVGYARSVGQCER